MGIDRPDLLLKTFTRSCRSQRISRMTFPLLRVATTLVGDKVVALLWRNLISLGYLPTALSSAVLGLSKFRHSGMRSLIAVTIVCLTSPSAFAFVVDTDCESGTMCLDGVCTHG